MAFILSSCSQDSATGKAKVNQAGVKLNWKIPNGDTLIYKTVMNQIGESSFEMNLGDLFEKMTEEDHEDSDLLGQDFFESIKDQFNNTNLITKLTNSDDFTDVIDIEIIAERKDYNIEEGTDETDRMMNSLMEGTMLRGSVYTYGSLHSFWMKNNQKNLLSLFFELPNKVLHKGDSWTLDNVNFISNDHNFICREAEKKNLATLTDIIEKDGNTIALIDYNILEYVLGDFNTPRYWENKGGNIPTRIEFIYKGQAEFSISEGKWISYNGIMSLDASGATNSKQKQKYALIEQ